jgi:hypothetical protein
MNTTKFQKNGDFACFFDIFALNNRKVNKKSPEPKPQGRPYF